MDTILDEMFKAGVHFGYSRSSRHPSMKPVIYGTKNRVEIINLEKTSEYLEKARELLKGLASGGKAVLFVGTKNEAREAVRNAADMLNMPYVTERWVGGIFTNFSEIKKRIARMKDLAAKKAKGELDVYTKKERLILQWEQDRLEKLFGGLVDMTEKPAVIFVVDTKKEKIAVAEARKMGVPVIALMNTDCEFKDADYPIPGNDASVASIQFILNQLVSAYRNK
ncbi:MAG: 30S ribosomal protein S2 [Candidatus Paceibacterota bacterium]|jgi:small subunit ribosomal protein S2